MKRKLQIFVSSTYRDLLAERQSAVEAILRAGHIPAGMELFAAGDKSQLETIYRWIDESDVFMLILGGRYGSVDKDSGKSYTQLEYEHAIATGKRFFAVVLTDTAIDQKLKTDGRSAIESDHPKELSDFRRIVMSKICRMVDDSKDIKLAIHETILEFLREYSFDGWVSGKNVVAAEDMQSELARLARENADLRAELLSIRSSKKPSGFAETDFDAILDLLNSEHLTYQNPNAAPGSPEAESVRMSVTEWFYSAKNELLTGISNTYNMPPYHNFLFFEVSPHLSMHGLTEDQKVTGVRWRTMKTTKKGNEFLVYLQKRLSSEKMNAAAIAAAPKPSQEQGSAKDVSVVPESSAVKPVAKKSAGTAARKAKTSK